MRSLDALHLAAALVLGEELAGIVAYDRRLLAAAASLEIAAVSPTARREEHILQPPGSA